ncbi:glycosyltransferase [Sphingomonadaceae bacterium]|nr:glycosyltransferase [Sphingomonadaceae bacterium]
MSIPPAKRVLSIATLYPNTHTPRFGTFVARSLEALAARGDWRVTVINPIGIAPFALGRYKKLAQAATDGTEGGVEVHRPTFTLIPKVGARSNPATIAKAILPLVRKLHAQQPFDMVDAQFFYPDGPAAAQIARALDLPFSIKARGSDITYWGTKDFARSQMVEAAHEASGLLSVSQALAEDMKALGMDGDKIMLHYTGLDRDRFRPLGHVGLRKMLGERLGIALRENEKLLSTVGALIPRKGQEFAIGAVGSIPDARLLLVGTGEDEKHLQSLARDFGVAGRVHFLGSVDHDLLPIILSASDAMVLPSDNEGLANAWVEALACGTPLVICDAGGAKELVSGPDAGVIVERTPDGVAAGIRQVLDNLPSAERAAAVTDQFSWQANGAALAAHFDRLIFKNA